MSKRSDQKARTTLARFRARTRKEGGEYAKDSDSNIAALVVGCLEHPKVPMSTALAREARSRGLLLTYNPRTKHQYHLPTHSCRRLAKEAAHANADLIRIPPSVTPPKPAGDGGAGDDFDAVCREGLTNVLDMQILLGKDYGWVSRSTMAVLARALKPAPPTTPAASLSEREETRLAEKQAARVARRRGNMAWKMFLSMAAGSLNDDDYEKVNWEQVVGHALRATDAFLERESKETW